MPSKDPAKNREYVKRHYYAHKQKYFDRNIRIRALKIAYVRDLKNAPCSDCGIKYPSYVMEFDHRNAAEKFDAVSKMLTLGWAKIKAEIAKCDLVCANCHRERTHQRANGGMADTPHLECGVKRHAGSSPA